MGLLGKKNKRGIGLNMDDPKRWPTDDVSGRLFYYYTLQVIDQGRILHFSAPGYNFFVIQFVPVKSINDFDNTFFFFC